MKIRRDFVTNSSSSSFIVAFNSKEEGIEFFNEKERIDDIFKIVSRDFENAKPMTVEDVLKYAEEEFLGDTHYVLMCKKYKNHYSFVDYLKEKYKDVDYPHIFDLREYKEKQAELVKDQMENFKKQIKDKSYFAELEYEDHTSSGSELEHEIMPYLECTIERFSHH